MHVLRTMDFAIRCKRGGLICIRCIAHHWCSKKRSIRQHSIITADSELEA